MTKKPILSNEDYINGYNEGISTNLVSENLNYEIYESYRKAKNKQNWIKGFNLALKLKKRNKI